MQLRVATTRCAALWLARQLIEGSSTPDICVPDKETIPMSNGDKDQAEDRLATLYVPNERQWKLVVGAMRAQGQQIKGDPGKATIEQPSRFTVYLNGLEYDGQPAHITLTPGPKETLEFTYFHFTISFLKGTGSHAFYQLVYDAADQIIPKLTTKLVVEPGQLKEAKEHNARWANDQALASSVADDIRFMVEEMETRFGKS
jgi:hypothetical protein